MNFEVCVDDKLVGEELLTWFLVKLTTVEYTIPGKVDPVLAMISSLKVCVDDKVVDVELLT